MTPPNGHQEAEMAAPVRPLLTVNNIEVIYDHVILVLKGVSLEVPEGGIVALLGANGAGKTTTLKAISNLLGAERGEVTKGSIECVGERVDRLSPNELVRRGVIQVMEGRRCFEHLTVEKCPSVRSPRLNLAVASHRSDASTEIVLLTSRQGLTPVSPPEDR